MRSVHLSRRQAVAGAAWSLPAVALVNAAPAFAASVVDVDLSISFDHDEWGDTHRWGPGRFYVCTQVTNNGSTATSGPVVVTLSTPPGVKGMFPTPFGASEWPTGWTKDGEGTNVLTVTIPGPVPAYGGLHVSYWWTTDADTDEVACVAGVSGGGELPALIADNATTLTVSRPTTARLALWMGDSGTGSLASGTARVYYGLVNGGATATEEDLVVTLGSPVAFESARVTQVHEDWTIDVSGPVTATYTGRLAPGAGTPSFEIEWSASAPLTEVYYSFPAEVRGSGGQLDALSLNISNS